MAAAVRRQMSKEQEELWVLALNSSKSLLAKRMVFRGTVDACLVHPRDIFRLLFEFNASSFVIAHNHPSGTIEPSFQDCQFTRRLAACAEIFEVPLLDHVIVGGDQHTSLISTQPWLFQPIAPSGATNLDPGRYRKAVRPKSH